MSRPRSVAAHDKALEAALTLFAERGIDAASMDAIAERSGVSKATLYKHWKDKEALALEALETLYAGLHEVPPSFDSGNLRRDLIDVLTYQPAAELQALKNRILPHLMAYAARHPEFGQAWRARVMGMPQTRLKVLLRRGIEEKKLEKGIDVEMSLALLLGPMFYWHITTGNKSAKLPPRDWAEKVVASFLKAHAL